MAGFFHCSGADHAYCPPCAEILPAGSQSRQLAAAESVTRGSNEMVTRLGPASCLVSPAVTNDYRFLQWNETVTNLPE